MLSARRTDSATVCITLKVLTTSAGKSEGCYIRMFGGMKKAEYMENNGLYV